MKFSPLSEAFELAQGRYTAEVQPTGALKRPLELRAQQDFRLPAQGLSADALRADMRSYLAHTTNTLTPKFQNQLFSGLNPYALAGEWLAALTNTTMATFEVSPFATLAERELVSHMNRKAGWSDGDGIMVTGGSNANGVGMLLARNRLFPQTKHDGCANLRPTLFVSAEAHYSFDKMANLMGLGQRAVKKVPVDERGHMKPEALRELILASRSQGETPFFVAATAGTTVLGAYDPLKDIAAVCRELGLWFHVDGSWGASVLLSRRHRHLMTGIEEADSLAWDTHKMMGTGLVSSFFLTRHAGSLRASHDGGGADYIFHESESASWDSGPSSLQCGRRNDAFKVWLAWRALGDEGFEAHVDRLFDNARMARDLITERAELELLFEPEMLNVCFRPRGFNGPEVKALRERLLEKGQFFVNISTRQGETFFRLITAHPDLTRAHLTELFDSLHQLAQRPSHVS